MESVSLAIAAVALLAGLAHPALAQGNGKSRNKIDVALAAPPPGALYLAPATVRLVARAATTQKNHPIARVELLANGALVGAVPGPSADGLYPFAWTGVAPGTYALSARAINDKGDADVSGAVVIAVDAAPSVSVSVPVEGAIFLAPATVAIAADASDPDGTIAKVEFFRDGTLVGTATEAPYSATLTNLVSGVYRLSAVATDNAGATSTSGAVSVRVNAAPSVSLARPASGATFTAPASITIAASAADGDGSVAKVELYRGDVLVATLASPPYSFTLTGVPAGSYVLTAVATDDLGAATTSDPVTVIVKSVVAQMYFIEVDHLNTPRRISDQGGNEVWRWDNTEPFGDSVPNDDPSGFGVFEFAPRGLGQYSDRETGIVYNYFRYLDPARGQYEQSDPIGLVGGLNTYLYVDANPLSRTDPKGLLSCDGTWVVEKEVIMGGGVPSLNPCQCYWLCMPCRGQVAWSGNYLDLPSTIGIPMFNPNKPADRATGVKAGPNRSGGVSRGGAMGGGNSCLCDFPGEEKGCPACYSDGTGQASRTR